jgi:PKD repeat protein
LHPIPSVSSLKAEESDGIVRLSWNVQDSSQQMFAIYEMKDNEQVLMDIIQDSRQYELFCLEAGGSYTFMVRPVQLTHTASGSFYNLGTGEVTSIAVNESNIPLAGFDHSGYYERAIFTNTSASADKFDWDFGDGNRSDDEEPVHVYQQPGKYTVCLTAGNNECPEAVLCREIEVAGSLPSDVSAVFEEPDCYGYTNGGIKIFLTGGSEPDLIYTWDNGSMEKDLSDVPSGDYILTLKSGITGNSITRTFFLPQPDSLLVTATTTPSTGNDGTVTLEVEGGVPPYSFAWNGPVDWMKLPPGNYSITVTDINGCTETIEVVVEMASGVTDVHRKIIVWPNPVSDFIRIAVIKQVNHAYITNQKGEIILRYPAPVSEEGSITLDCTILKPGMYFILLSGQNESVKVLPFVKL